MGDFLNRIAIPIKATQHPLLLLLLLLLQSLEYLLHLDLQKATFLSQLNSLAISSSDTHSHRLFHPSHTHTHSLSSSCSWGHHVSFTLLFLPLSLVDVIKLFLRKFRFPFMVKQQKWTIFKSNERTILEHKFASKIYALHLNKLLFNFFFGGDLEMFYNIDLSSSLSLSNSVQCLF